MSLVQKFWYKHFRSLVMATVASQETMFRRSKSFLATQEVGRDLSPEDDP